MKRKPSDQLDPLAIDIYERAMHPYWSLQAEADRERLLRQIPLTGRPRPSRYQLILAGLGSALVTLGLWLQAAGKR